MIDSIDDVNRMCDDSCRKYLLISRSRSPQKTQESTGIGIQLVQYISSGNFGRGVT